MAMKSLAELTTQLSSFLQKKIHTTLIAPIPSTLITKDNIIWPVITFTNE